MNPLAAIALLEQQEWTFARSMPDIPHWYALRRNWRGTEDQFLDVVRCIRAFGTPEEFFGRTYLYLEALDWKYWTMDASVDGTTLINRARMRP